MGSKRNLDVVNVKINGEMLCISRSAHHEGGVLDALVSIRKDLAASLSFIMKAMK